MSTTYAGNNASFPTDITLPSDGDAKPVSSVNAALEGLADRTAYLAKLTSDKFGTVIRTVKNPPTPFQSIGVDTWKRDHISAVGGGTQLWQVNLTSGNGFSQLIDAPHGSTLATVYCCFQAAGSHAGVPTNKFEFFVYRLKLSSLTALPESIGHGVADGSSIGVYETFQEIAAAVNTVVDNSQYIYFLNATGEFGTNALADAKFLGSVIQLSVNDLDVGGS